MNLQFAFLEGDELSPAIERSREEWNREKGRDDYQRFMRALKETPWGRARWRAPALRTEGDVAATMFLYDFTFALENARVRVCAIASFGVRRDLRGRGIGRCLMEEVHELLAKEGCDAALLYSLIDPRYYERLGYTVLPTQHLEAGMDGSGAGRRRASAPTSRAISPPSAIFTTPTSARSAWHACARMITGSSTS
jgi:predicted N-acetyltransferase YhbS